MRVELRIGGEVSYPLLRRLFYEESLNLDSCWTGGPPAYFGAGVQIYFAPAPQQGHHLVVAGDRPNGAFEAAEEKLAAAGIRFDRISEGVQGQCLGFRRMHTNPPAPPQEWDVGLSGARVLYRAELEMVAERCPQATLGELLESVWAPQPPLPPIVFLDWKVEGLTFPARANPYV